ncbi:mast cell protease 2-like [Rhodnius prolixus]|uniref:mast cell protease 2-like n=1 Tax=Rhodnius prolixus TaxID=13249 RepID=UPI003D18FABF
MCKLLVMRKEQIAWVLQSILLHIVCSCCGFLETKGSRTYLGRIVNITEVPFIVLVVPGNQASCTGFIVAQKWVITAAHCFSITKEDTIVAIGTSDRRSHSKKLDVERVIVHPKYLLHDEYDIALIKLAKALKMTTKTEIIAVESTEWPDTKSKRLCYTVGFGHHISANMGGILHGGQVTVGRGSYPYRCEVMLYPLNDYLWTHRNESDAICFGDSGCPLVCDRKAVGIGIASLACETTALGTNDCGTNTVDIFVPLYRNLAWLKSYISCLPSSCSKGISFLTLNLNSNFLFIILNISLLKFL